MNNWLVSIIIVIESCSISYNLIDVLKSHRYRQNTKSYSKLRPDTYVQIQIDASSPHETKTKTVL